MTQLPFAGRLGREQNGGCSWRGHAGLALTAALALWVANVSPARAGGIVSGCNEQALRDAISGGGTVIFASDCSITLTQPLFIPAGDTTIDATGRSVTISGGSNTRIFVVTGNLTVRGLKLLNGKSNSGGAVLVQAGATFSADACTFQGNVATGTNGVAGPNGKNSASGQAGDGGNGTDGLPGQGGAIYNLGTVELSTCTFLTNSATGGNGGAGGNGGTGGGSLGQGGDGGSGGAGAVAQGGAVYNGGDMTVVDTTFRGNTVSSGDGGAGGAAGTGPFVGTAGQGGAGGAAYGGAIYNARNLQMYRSLLTANAATAGDSAAGGTNGNLDGRNGYNGGESGGGGLYSAFSGAVTNCTICGNVVRAGNGGNGGNGTGTLRRGGNGGNGGNGVGGGVQSLNTLFLFNCTLTANGGYGGTNGLAGSGTFAGQAGTPGSGVGGNLAAAGGAILRGTLIGPAAAGLAGSGTITGWGFNMCADDSIALGTNSYPSATPLNLDVLTDNGGPTFTVALLAGSVALDKIPPDFSPDTDQRGVPRNLNGASDIGAFESAASSPPIIYNQPVDDTTTIGATASFSVGAVGAPTLAYQWRLNATNIAGGTGLSYSVASPGTTNQGPYDVVITNSFGAVTSSVVYVRFQPVITTQPTNVVATAGNNVTFTVAAAGDPPLNYEWRFNATNVLASATGNTLNLTNVQAAQIGSYSVNISNSYGAILSVAATLNLKPSILTQPRGDAFHPGDAVTLTVEATGSQPLRYQWRFNGGNVAGATSSALVFSSIQFSNSGVYSVVVSNSYAGISSSNAVVAVTLPVSGSVFDETTNGLPGATVTVVGGAINGVVQTDTNGAFSFELAQGAYIVTPSLAGYGFLPASIAVSVPPGEQGLQFVARPMLSLAALTNGTVELKAGGLTNLSYGIETSSNLLNWVRVTNVPGPVFYSEPGPVKSVNRYYRLTR